MPIFKFIIVEVFLLGVVIFILKKLIFTDTTSALNRLNAERKKTEKKQQEIEDLKKQCDANCKEKIELTQKEVEKIKEAGVADAETKAKDIVAKARAQGEEIVQKAMEAKESMRNTIMLEMDKKVLTFSGELVAKVINKKITESFNNTLIEQFLSSIDEIDPRYITDIEGAEIVTKYKISEAQAEVIKKTLREKVGREIAVTEKLDDSLMGGIIIKFGTLILDGSLDCTIREMTEEMKKDLE